MRGRFKSKKSFKNSWKLVIIIILLFLFLLFFARFFLKIHLGIDDETFVYYILEDPNPYLCYEEKTKPNFDFFLKTIYQIDITKPVTFLQNTSYYIENKEKTVLVYNKDYQGTVLPIIGTEEEKPLVYIYNTHPTETFKNTELSNFNLEPSILEMSNVLKEKLEELGIEVIVENADIPAFLKEHSYTYNQSYIASRYYLEQACKNHPDIDLFIDLHRDGVDYDYSVTAIDGKKYAKVMFVVGLNHDNYQSSLDASNQINEYFTRNYPSISRGVFTNQYATYNQNRANNMVLIELGGNENELIEVLNTIDVLAHAIKEYIYEK